VILAAGIPAVFRVGGGFIEDGLNSVVTFKQHQEMSAVIATQAVGNSSTSDLSPQSHSDRCFMTASSKSL
jgi:hypothetical protein